MNNPAALKVLGTTFMIALLAACANTKPIGEWRSESFSGKFNNVLVIGVTSRSTRRRVWEDAFVTALGAQGISGLPSYTLLESSLELTRDIVERAIDGQGLDGVLVTRLVGIEQEQTFRLPAAYDDDRGYLGYYDHAWRQSSGGYYAQHSVFTLETSLYDVASDRLVWKMQSRSMDRSQPRTMIDEIIRLQAQTLKRHGLI